MNIRVWYATSDDDFANYIIDNTILSRLNCEKKQLRESDANNAALFHQMPDHIKKILYLDCPDLIVEINQEPIFSIEISNEAGTGHNAFQRFARLAASVENDVPALYIYPEATIIKRGSGAKTNYRWDKINPLIFHALENTMSIYNIPALLFYNTTDFRATSTNPKGSRYLASKGLIKDSTYIDCPDSSDSEMKKMFKVIDMIINRVNTHGVIGARQTYISSLEVRNHRTYMQSEFVSKGGNLASSPLSSCIKIRTDILLNYLSKYHTGSYQIGELLRSRAETIVYMVNMNDTANTPFRGDPYPGCLAAIDYILCRQGKTFEEREHNLVFAIGHLEMNASGDNFIVKPTFTHAGATKNNVSIDEFVKYVKDSDREKNILDKDYSSLRKPEIPRYYMQVRYGSMFSKVKHIRAYAYFADAILFHDGDLWRDG